MGVFASFNLKKLLKKYGYEASASKEALNQLDDDGKLLALASHELSVKIVEAINEYHRITDHDIAACAPVLILLENIRNQVLTKMESADPEYAEYVKKQLKSKELSEYIKHQGEDNERE